MADRKAQTEPAMQVGVCLFLVGALSLPLAALVSWTAVAVASTITCAGAVLIFTDFVS